MPVAKVLEATATKATKQQQQEAIRPGQAGS